MNHAKMVLTFMPVLFDSLSITLFTKRMSCNKEKRSSGSRTILWCLKAASMSMTDVQKKGLYCYSQLWSSKYSRRALPVAAPAFCECTWCILRYDELIREQHR